MWRHSNAIATVCLAVFLLVRMGTAAPPNVEILPIVSNTLDKHETANYTRILETWAVQTQHFQVRIREQHSEIVRTLIESYQRGNLLEASDSQIEIGRILNVAKVIAGQIEQEKGIYTILLRIVDIETSRIEWSVFSECDKRDISETLKALVEELGVNYRGMYRPSSSASPDASSEVVDSAPIVAPFVWEKIENIELEWSSLGHSGAVYSIAIHPSGELFASAGADNNVRLWNYDRPEYVKTYEARNTSVTSIVFSNDGRYLLLGDEDGQIRIHNLEYGTESALTGHSGRINRIVMSPSGKWFATASSDATIRIWDLYGQKTQREIKGLAGPVNALAICDDNLIAASIDDVEIQIWDRNNAQLQKTLHGHTSAVNDLAIGKNKGTLFSAGDDNTVRVWNVNLGILDQTIPQGDAFEVMSIVGVAGTDYFITGTLMGKIHIGHVEGDVDISDTPVGKEAVSIVVYDPMTQRLITAGDRTGEIRVWRLTVQ